jgi:hypothetical protein
MEGAMGSEWRVSEGEGSGTPSTRTHRIQITSSVYVKKARPLVSVSPQAVNLIHPSRSTQSFIALGTGRAGLSRRKSIRIRASVEGKRSAGSYECVTETYRDQCESSRPGNRREQGQKGKRERISCAVLSPKDETLLCRWRPCSLRW